MVQELRALSRFMKHYHIVDIFDVKNISGRPARHRAVRKADSMLEHSQNKSVVADYKKNSKGFRIIKKGNNFNDIEKKTEEAKKRSMGSYVFNLQKECLQDESPITRDDQMIKYNWETVAAPIVAHNMGCQVLCYMHNDRQQTSFFGRRKALKNCVHIFRLCLSFGNDIIERKTEIDRNEGRQPKNSMDYVFPFIEDVRKEMEKNSETLGIAIPPEVDERIKKAFPDYQK